MIRSEKKRSVVWVSMMVMGMIALCPAVLRAQNASAVLDMAPANSEIVIAIPSLTALNKKLATLNAALGMVVPWMNDTLGEVKRGSGMVNGLDDRGGALLVLNGLIEAKDAHVDKPPYLLLLPVGDYNAFIGNFNTKPAAGNGMTPVTLPQGESAFVRRVGHFAVLGADWNTVKAYAPGNAGQAMITKSGKLGSKYATSSDFLVMVDLNTLGPKLMPKLNKALDAMDKALENNPRAKADSPVDPAAIAKIYRQVVTSFLSGTSTMVMGLDLSELGVGTSTAVQFKPGSDIASFFKANNSTAAKLLTSIPNEPYLFAMAQNFKSFDMKRINTAVDDVLKTASPELQTMIHSLMPMVTQTNGTSMAYYPGQMNLAGSLFNGATVINTDDPAAYVKSFHSYLDTLAKTALPIKLPPTNDGNGPPPDAKVTFFTQYNAGTTQAEGISVDQYEVRYDLPPALLAQMNPQMMMFMGMTSQRGYVAQVNGKVVITTSSDLPTLTKAINAAKQGQGLNADMGVTQIRQQLTPNADFEAYLNIGTMASTGLGFAQAFGLPVDVQVPANLPPVGYSMSLSTDTMASRTYIPMKVIKFTKDLAVTLAPLVQGMRQQGQQGQQGQDDGQGGPPPR